MTLSREAIAQIIAPSAFYRKRKGRLNGDVNPADRLHNRERVLAKADQIIALISPSREEGLREALKPFAAISYTNPKIPDEAYIRVYEWFVGEPANGVSHVQVRDFRRARTALRHAGGGE